MQPPIENDNENILVDATLEQNNKLDELNDSNEAQLQGIIQTNEQLDELNSGVDLLVEKLSEEKEVPMTKFSFEVDGAEIQTIEGMKGDKGEKGDKGDRGEIGLTGKVGANGDKGDKGDAGEQGIQGIQGEKGMQGFPGLKGEKGDKGDRGSDGKNGKDAKEIAVDKLVKEIKDSFPIDDLKKDVEGVHTRINKIASKTYSLKELDDVDLSTATITNGKYVIGSGSGSSIIDKTAITGILKGNGTDISAALSGTDLKTINGTSIIGSGDIATGAGISIGDTITSATAGRVLYAGAGGVLADSSSLLYDYTNNFLGVGGTPSTKLDVYGALATSIFNTNTSSSAASINIASMLSPSATGDSFLAVGRSISLANTALFGFSSASSTDKYAFVTTYGRPASDFNLTTSGNIGIGMYNPSSKLHIKHAVGTSISATNNNIVLEDSTSTTEGVGASLILSGAYSSTTNTFAAGIKTSKANSTSGEYDFNLKFFARKNGQSSLTEYMELRGADGALYVKNAIELGHADDTTISRVSAGLVAIEGNNILTTVTGAAIAQTFYIGTTQVAINRTSAALTLAGLTLTTPVLGVATATSINKVAITAPATASTLTIADGQTLTVNGSATITNGTHSGTNTGDNATNSTYTTLATTIATANTWTATQTEKAVVFTNNAITATTNAATVPVTHRLNTVTNNSAATLTITMTTASAVDGQMTMVRILDSSAVAQTIAWVNTENSTVSAPTTSNGSTTLFRTVGFIYNGATSKWRCIADA